MIIEDLIPYKTNHRTSSPDSHLDYLRTYLQLPNVPHFKISPSRYESVTQTCIFLLQSLSVRLSVSMIISGPKELVEPKSLVILIVSIVEYFSTPGFSVSFNYRVLDRRIFCAVFMRVLVVHREELYALCQK